DASRAHASFVFVSASTMTSPPIATLFPYTTLFRSFVGDDVDSLTSVGVYTGSLGGDQFNGGSYFNDGDVNVFTIPAGAATAGTRLGVETSEIQPSSEFVWFRMFVKGGATALPSTPV